MGQLNSYAKFLDKKVQKHSAFKSYEDLLSSVKKHGYIPSLYIVAGEITANKEKIIIANNLYKDEKVTSFMPCADKKMHKMLAAFKLDRYNYWLFIRGLQAGKFSAWN